MAKNNPLSTSLTGPNVNAPSSGAKGSGLRTLKIQQPTLTQAPQPPKATPPAPILQDQQAQQTQAAPTPMKKGGKVSASKRADGCCIKGKTRA